MADALRPLASVPAAALARVRGVFADIDDTLTTDGKLTAAAYAAMEALRASGLVVVPITGRPAGWCDHIARMWPVDGVVGENGAFWFAHDDAKRKLVKRFLDDDATRATNRARLVAVRDRILAEVPGTALASDQLYREADLAIDFCEDVPRLPDAAIDRVVAIMGEAGMTAKISSIHVNGWFGRYDKLGMTRTLMQERFGIDLDARRSEFMFVGDSPNDAPMFRYFPLSVGVANVRQFGARLEHPPAYVTEGTSGAGFVELAGRLLATRPADRHGRDQ
ncbi:MAG: phosphoglycolate phosphatase [Proteobacteria bacterium]|nr:phosphoglycolate phosphatase [Pseudomonadota bacterium]